MCADSVDTKQVKTPSNLYRNLFDPRSIAVIGASNDELKPGGRVTKNLKIHGYAGDLWAVNPKSPDIFGLPTFPTIVDLPHGPDLAIVAIPSRFALEAIQDLAAKGTGAVIVLTAGFGEKDEAGKEIERRMVAIAEKAGMAVIGPNCSGFLTNTYKGKFAGIVPDLPGRTVDFISGSGATVDYVMESATRRGLSFNIVLNLGNSIQMGVEDLLELYDENYGPQHARILMLYMESIRKPVKLLRHARSLINKGCALVGIKSGATDAGARAAASHTGAMANSDTAVEALFAKAGIIRVTSKAALINVGCVLAAAKGHLTGKRACIITDAGGPGVMLSDELYRQGLELPALTEKTRQRLAEVLPREASLVNPIDALPSRSAQQIKAIFEILDQEERDRLDVIAVLTGDSGMSDNAPIYQEIVTAMETCTIPVIPVLSSVVTSREKIRRFCSQGKVYFQDEVPLGEALGRVARWRRPEEEISEPKGYQREAVAQALSDCRGVLSPETVAAVLTAAGFRLPPQVEVSKKENLAAECARVGFPLAMKVIGPLHKTDVGGVKLGIADADEAARAWDGMLQIPGAEGVLLQPMIGGLEVILGASREGDFGHLVMFGLGGIYAEVLKDVAFGLAPIAVGESLDMVRRLRSYALLEGVRGEPGIDIDLLCDHIQRLGRLVSDFPRIREMDLNPLKGTGKTVYAVDARIILDN
jgi:acyl-CoA synthetase (NDP forming)